MAEAGSGELDKGVPPARAAALGVILREHRQLSGVLTLLNLLLEDVRSGHQAPDFKLLSLIMCYIDQFPDRFHHRKEDLYLFARLRAHGVGLKVLDRCEEEHRIGGHLLLGLARTFIAYQAGLPGASAEFADCCAAYTQFHLQHMQCEETEVLPLALRHLTPADWIEINHAFGANSDPLRGLATERTFHLLHQSIAERVPSRRGNWLRDVEAHVELPTLLQPSAADPLSGE